MTDDLGISPTTLQRLRSARHAMALTGAGISAESGIPTFRAPDTVVEVNPEETELTHSTNMSLRGPAGTILPRLARLLAES